MSTDSEKQKTIVPHLIDLVVTAHSEAFTQRWSSLDHPNYFDRRTVASEEMTSNQTDP